MATTVAVYPREGTSYPDAAGVPIDATGAIVDVSKYIRDAIGAGFLLTWDPLGVYLPDDRSGGSSGGGELASYATQAALAAIVGSPGTVAVTRGCLAEGDGGGGMWQWSHGSSLTDNIGTVAGASSSGRWIRIIDAGYLDVRWFGARGNNDQTLVSHTYSVNNGSFVYTQQTRDGKAICQAIAFARAHGIGSVFIPPGTYRIHGFLEDLNFSVRLFGAGAGVTVLKSRDAAPVNVNGYGIVFSRPTGYQQVSLESMTLDGNVYTRGQPTTELVSYNMAFEGKARVRISDVESINSPIDCLLVYLDNDPGVSLTATNLWCSDAYRNVCSVISGDNIDISDSLFQKAGYPFNGTNPRYVVDIEPEGDLSVPLKGLKFTNCVFKQAYGVYLVGQVWSKATFVNCLFDGSDGSPEGGHYPFLQGSVGSETDCIGCTYKKLDSYRGHTESSFITGGEFEKTQYMNYVGCSWEGAAPAAYGPRLTVSGCKITNSLYPFIVSRTAGGTFSQAITIDGLQMLNVFDRYNYTGGEFAALYFEDRCKGHITLANTDVVFDSTRLPKDPAISNLWKSTDVNGATGYGIDCYANHNPANESCVRMMNVSASGYTYDLAAFAGVSPSLNYADWHHDGLWPSITLATPPADTPGQTAPMPGLWARNCSSRGA